MQIKVGFEITYTAPLPTPMVIMLSIHPSRRHDIIGAETITTDPDVPIRYYYDFFGNICGRLVAPPGGVTLRGDALVRDSGLPDTVAPDARQMPIEQLPDDVLVYLMASRYCETDKLVDLAWSLFGNIQPGWERVMAICNYVHDRITFGYEHAHHMKSAFDAHEQRAGVCRDFAHLALTLCRCMGIPARYCTGYMGDIGIPPEPDADGFLRLVRGLSVRPMVHLRRPSCRAADRPHRDGDRARCRRRRAVHEFRTDEPRQVFRRQR